MQINRKTNKFAMDKMKIFDNIGFIFLISRKEKEKENECCVAEDTGISTRLSLNKKGREKTNEDLVRKRTKNRSKHK